MPKEIVKLSDYVFQFLSKKGVKHVFMLPGGGAMHLVDSLGNCKKIQFVCNLHEQACAIAAEAYARFNNLGVALVTTGPGGTNAITGVVGAWLESTPCLFISGQVKRADLKKGFGVRQRGVQEVDIVTLIKSVTKYAVTITEPSLIKYHLEKSVFLAQSGRPGPVWLDIPLDVQTAMIEPDKLKGFDPKIIKSRSDALKIKRKVAKVIDLLNNSERPVILAGAGITLAGARHVFRQLIDRLGIPVLTTWPAMDLLPYSHKFLVGRYGSIAPRGPNFALQNSDLLIAIGTRMSMQTVAYDYNKLAPAAKKIMIDIDPYEISKIKRIIDFSIVCDAGDFIMELSSQKAKIKKKKRSFWLTCCKKWKSKYPVVLKEHREQKDAVSTYVLAEALSDVLTGNDVIATGSSGNAVEIFLLAFKSKNGQRVIHTRALSSMGFDIPAAIGACLGSGRRPTICVTGDGGFQMNIQELETLARLRFPIKFFVVNNRGYASIRNSQRLHFHRLTGADATSGLTLPDLVKVATAYGLTAKRISEQKNLKQKIKEILKISGPVICEVMAPTDEICAPRAISRTGPGGRMVSASLEDLWPFLERDEFLSNMIDVRDEK